MPPIEAIACGCPVILGGFYRARMRYVYGDDALYAATVEEMVAALHTVLACFCAPADSAMGVGCSTEICDPRLREERWRPRPRSWHVRSGTGGMSGMGGMRSRETTWSTC